MTDTNLTADTNMQNATNAFDEALDAACVTLTDTLTSALSAFWGGSGDASGFAHHVEEELAELDEAYQSARREVVRAVSAANAEYDEACEADDRARLGE